jgi:hypothetical protein
MFCWATWSRLRKAVGLGQGSALAQRGHQGHDERLLAPGAVQIGEQLVVVVAAQAHERHRLRGVDLLDATVKIRTGVGVRGVVVEAYGDRLHDLCDLKERTESYFDEAVDRHTQ